MLNLRFILLLFASCTAILLSAQSADTFAYSIELTDVVVTGQPTPMSAQDALHEVRVITQADMQARGFTRLSEVLEREVALSVRQDPILGAGLDIQGLGGQNVQILIDGMPVTGRMNGKVDLSQIDLSEIVRIEIVAGSLSAQYGSNASGGVVNLITRREQSSPISVRAESQVEDLGIRYGSVGVGFQKGRWQVGGGMNLYEANFGSEAEYRQRRVDTLVDGSSVSVPVLPWNPKEQIGWRANAGVRLKNELRLDYKMRGFREELTLFGQVRRPQFKPYVTDETYTTTRLDHQVLLQGYVAPKWYVNATAGYNQFDRLKSTVRTDMEPDTIRLVAGGADTTRYSALLARASTQYEFNDQLKFQLGIEVLRESAAGGRILDASTGEPEPTMTNYASWLGVEYAPTDELSVGLTTRVGINSVYNHPVLPAIHLRYALNKHWIFRTNYARGFRAPSIQELHFNFIDINHFIIGNTELKAEQSGNFNASANYERMLGKAALDQEVSLGVRVYHNAIRDRITLFEFEPGRFSYGNIDDFQTRGLIMTGGYSRGERWQAQLSFGLLQFNTGLGGELEPARDFTSATEASAQIGYLIPRLDIDFRADYRFFGRQIQFVEVDETTVGERTTAAYHLLNLTSSRAFWQDRIRLTAGAKNVLDIQTVRVLGASEGGAHSGGSASRLVGFGRLAFVRVGFVF